MKKILTFILGLLLLSPNAFADSKLSALSNNGSPSGSDLTYDVASGTSYNITLSQVKSYVLATNVGIGSATPGQALDVIGTIRGTAFINKGGLSTQFQKADGSLDSSTYSTQTFGTLTNTDWCNTNGTSISCTQAIPAPATTSSTVLQGNGAGGFTNVSLGATGVLGLNSSNQLVSGSGYIATLLPITLASPNVGIGSTNPGQTLDVSGTVRTQYFAMSGTGPANGYVLTSTDNSGDASWKVLSAGSGTVASGTIGQEAVYTGSTTVGSGNITDVTNIGIGSFHPGSLLDVQGSLRVLGSGSNLQVGTPSITDTGILGQFTSSTNSYNQVLAQNTSSGSAASTNFIVNNNNGTSTTYYGEFGMNSSGFTGTGSWNLPNAVYLDAATADLALGTLGNSPVHFFTNSSATDAMDIVGQNVGVGSTLPGTALDVNGTARMTGFTMNNAVTANYVLTVASGGNATWQPALNLTTSGSSGAASYTVSTGTLNIPQYTGAGGSNYWNLGTGGNIGIDTAVPNSGVGIGTTFGNAQLTVMGGNVGIGTWNPQDLFSVGGASNFRVNSGGTISEINGSTNSTLSQNILILTAAGAQAQVKNSSGSANSGMLIIGSVLGTSGENVELRTSTGNDTNGFIRMTGGNAGGTEIARFTDSGNVGIGSTLPGQLMDVKGTLRMTGIGHFSSSGTAPTVASNACGSTTQGTIVAKSTDISGTVTVGTLTVTSCAITFANVWNSPPVCVANDDTNVLAIKPTETATGITFTSLSSASGDNISWICIGNE
jgi:hypothetical protein